MVASLQPSVVSKAVSLSAAPAPYPYQPDHQVELLHLQAELDALMLQLQAAQGLIASGESDQA